MTLLSIDERKRLIRWAFVNEGLLPAEATVKEIQFVIKVAHTVDRIGIKRAEACMPEGRARRLKLIEEKYNGNG